MAGCQRRPTPLGHLPRCPYFGFEIPDQPGKYFYVWLDAPIGYLCSFKTLCTRIGEDFDTHLRSGTTTELHHFIGKDIVNFHALFWPAVLHGTGRCAPTRLHVNGYLTVDGAKMSKSRGTFIMARTYLDAGLEPDALRYYFAAKSSGDVDDLDLNLSDFVARVNADLVGKLVNLASRCASFIGTRFNGQLADILPDRIQYDQFVAALTPIRDAYERNDTASAIRQTMQLADEANKYIDETKPWIIAKQHHADAQLHAVCTQGLNLFRVLITALKPILPHTSIQAETFLAAPVTTWQDVNQPLTGGHTIQPYSPLFTRIDKKIIEVMINASKDTLAPPLLRPNNKTHPCQTQHHHPLRKNRKQLLPPLVLTTSPNSIYASAKYSCANTLKGQTNYCALNWMLAPWASARSSQEYAPATATQRHSLAATSCSSPT